MLLTFFAAVAGTVLGPAGPASAAPSGPAPQVRATLAAPESDYSSRLSFDVSSIDPTLVTASGPSTLTITGTMTNTGPEELIDLSYRMQRGEALRSTAAVHDEIADPSEPIAQVPSGFEPVAGTLAAGASAPFAFTAALTGTDGLDIRQPGVYPLMVNVNGAVVLTNGPLEARIGELHLLLTVLGVPGSTAAAPTGTPTPFNFVWPMVDVPHLGVDGIFLNDDLLTAISPGGRLDTLLDALTGPAIATLPPGALTVVLDPQLLDELDRMTGPYRVVAPPGASQPPISAIDQAAGSVPPPTGTGTAAPTPDPSPDPGALDIPGTVAGTGQQAAASYLARLRAVAQAHPVVLLPYGDPDVVALVRAGMTGEVTTAQEHGREVAQQVWSDLGAVSPSAVADPTSSMAFPIDGAADGATLSTLMAGGARTGLLSQPSVEVPTDTAGRPGSAAIITTGQDGQTLPTAVAQTDVLGGLDKLITEHQPTGWATKVNSLTALLAQQRTDGTATPAVFAPTRRWSPDSAALAGLGQLLGELSRSAMIAGVPLATLAGGAQPNGRTDYPEAARERELSPAYLQRIATDRADVAGLRAALTSVSQPSDPAEVLDPLDAALDAAASTAFRTDPTVGEANLATVESTVTGIRAGVQIATSSTNYTLASSTSPLVLTVQNSTAYDVPVTVQLTGGEMVGLTTTEQPVQIIPAGRSQQVKIPTEVTRSGQFQVTATLVGPDGTVWGSPVQLSVQSSAYGALTVILMAVAGGVLVIMVALRIRQRLRGRRARIAAAARGAADPADAEPGEDARAGARPADHHGDHPGERSAARHSDRLVAETITSPTPSPTPPPAAAHPRSDQRQEFRS